MCTLWQMLLFKTRLTAVPFYTFRRYHVHNGHPNPEWSWYSICTSTSGNLQFRLLFPGHVWHQETVACVHDNIEWHRSFYHLYCEWIALLTMTAWSDVLVDFDFKNTHTFTCFTGHLSQKRVSPCPFFRAQVSVVLSPSKHKRDGSSIVPSALGGIVAIHS